MLEPGDWGLRTGRVGLGAWAPQRVRGRKDWQRGLPAFLRRSKMGGNPPASALLAGGGDGLEGWRAWRDAKGRQGQLGAPTTVSKYPPPRDTPKSRLGPGKEVGEVGG